MASKRTPKNAAKKPKKSPQVIELSSDSEPDAPVVKEQVLEPAKEVIVREYNQKDYDEMPLLKVEGIKYETEQGVDEERLSASEQMPAKLPVRVKDTGSTRHRHVSIEIPLLSSSMLAKGGKSQEVPGSEDANEEDVFKTPMERRHITFNDSDQEEFVTPMEAPLQNPLEKDLVASSKLAKAAEEKEEEDSDDDAPEAISSHAAEAHLAKASQAATKAAQKQAATQKQKRQERDTFLKQQAEKRKSTQTPAGAKSEDEGSEPEMRKSGAFFPEKRKREVPRLLPLELLESDDEDEAGYFSDSSTSKGVTKKQKIVTGWLPEAKAPRDQKVGSTVFRVVENRGDKKLAPKAKKTAVNLRESLLKRKKAPQAKSGFFVKSH